MPKYQIFRGFLGDGPKNFEGLLYPPVIWENTIESYFKIQFWVFPGHPSGMCIKNMSTKSLCDFILCSVSDVLLYYYLQGVPKKCPFLVFWSPLVNQMSYRKSLTMWIKLKLSAFSKWLYIFCITFGMPIMIKRKSPNLPKIT